MCACERVRCGCEYEDVKCEDVSVRVQEKVVWCVMV